MTTTEDRARAAMRAIARTVEDAPPLPLTPVSDPGPSPDEVLLGELRPGSRWPRPRWPESRWPRPQWAQSPWAQSPWAQSPWPRPQGPRPQWARRQWPGRAARRGGGHRRRRWPVLAPVAAAAVVVALAVALVLVRGIPNGRVAASASPTASAAAGNGPATAGVPGYYVAWMQADKPYLVVGDTVTGKRVGTIPSPPGVRLEAVYGTAADGRTFIVAGAATPAAGGGTVWYRLSISPGGSAGGSAGGSGGNPAFEFGALPIAVDQVPTGAALSPDGGELAIALGGGRPELQIYSVATGARLRSLTTKTPGEIMTEKLPPGSWQDTAMTLRWSANGRQLAFDWNGLAIRSLDATAPDGDFIASSRLVAVTGTTYATLGSFTCDAAQGWQLFEDGQGIVCAGTSHTSIARPCGRGQQCAYVQGDALGFLRQQVTSQGGTETRFYDSESAGTGPAAAGDGAYLGWANDDGSVLIGSLARDGKARFGIFRGRTFTPLPALPASLPASLPTPAGVLDGTVTW